MAIEITIYKTTDGREFTDQAEASNVQKTIDSARREASEDLNWDKAKAGLDKYGKYINLGSFAFRNRFKNLSGNDFIKSIFIDNISNTYEALMGSTKGGLGAVDDLRK